MKKIIILLSLIGIIGQSYAQTEKPANKTAGNNFEQYYNADNYDAIFNMFDASMQAALPIDKTKAFLANLKSQAGSIGKREFTMYEKGTYATYKTTFTQAILALHISVNDAGKINGLFVGPYTDNSLPQITRNTTKLILPFKDEWTVVWGGDTKELNYHVESVAQKNAFDIVITDAKGKSYKTDGQTNQDYYAFGKPLFAPCAGEVVLVVDGVKDNKPGNKNPVYVPGNTVIIKTANNEYLFFAHFKQHSIVVKQGQQLKQGDELGQCGNTGNSTEPHVHFHIQNVEDMTVATGVKCYFDKILVNGQLKTDYSPIQKEKIKNP
ncbi:MAG: peptidoglycan DD-metalloendopeptidase family protein [Bacteroidota bacterium]